MVEKLHAVVILEGEFVNGRSNKLIFNFNMIYKIEDHFLTIKFNSRKIVKYHLTE